METKAQQTAVFLTTWKTQADAIFESKLFPIELQNCIEGIGDLINNHEFNAIELLLILRQLYVAGINAIAEIEQLDARLIVLALAAYELPEWEICALAPNDEPNNQPRAEC